MANVFYIYDPVAELSNGLISTLTSTTQPDPPAVQVKTNTSGTAIVFEVTTAEGSSMRLLYRVRGTLTYSNSDVLETPAIGETITISGLTNGVSYDVVAFAYSSAAGAGTRSEPGSSLIVTTTQTSGVVAATNEYSLPLSNLKDLLAASTTFQTMVGAGSAEDAKAYIHLVALAVGDIDRPFALIATGDDWNSNCIGTGSSDSFITGGTLQLMFEMDISSSYTDSPQNAEFDFMNRIGAIIKEMDNLSGTTSGSTSYIYVSNFNLMDGPARTMEEKGQSQGDYYQVVFNISWGLSQ